MFEKRFKYFRDILQERDFAGFDCFPPPAKIALMDMIYNLGETKFTRHRWSDLFKAVKQREWEAAAKACHRKGIGEERNARTKDFFLKAEKMEEKSQQ